MGAFDARAVTLADLERLAEGGLLWAVADGCDEPRVPAKAGELGPGGAVSLWDASARAEELEVAPYLLRLDRPALAWLLRDLAAGPWGILAVARDELAALRRHFEELLTVEDPAGVPLYFRYYDPRVLPAFLGACTRGEVVELLGPCEALGVTGPPPAVATFFS